MRARFPFRNVNWSNAISFRLSFRIGSNDSVAKIAEFPTYELFRAYIEAETKDLKCQDAYFEYQAAKLSRKRRELAKALNLTRELFFDQWAKKNMPRSNHPPVPPPEEDIVA